MQYESHATNTAKPNDYSLAYHEASSRCCAIQPTRTSPAYGDPFSEQRSNVGGRLPHPLPGIGSKRRLCRGNDLANPLAMGQSILRVIGIVSINPIGDKAKRAIARGLPDKSAGCPVLPRSFCNETTKTSGVTKFRCNPHRGWHFLQCPTPYR